MSINIGEEKSKIRIYKDEKGRYFTYIKGQEIKENGEKEDIYMSKKLSFKKGIELKNKTVIEVIRGWNTCYRIETGEETLDGEPKYKYHDKFFILDFNILEEGTDEVMQSHEYKQKQKDIEEYSFTSVNDDLPF